MPRCPHPECSQQIPANFAFCRSHWFALPRALRDPIWNTFKARKRAAGEADVSRAEKAREEHEAALQAALDFFSQEVQGRES